MMEKNIFLRNLQSLQHRIQNLAEREGHLEPDLFYHRVYARACQCKAWLQVDEAPALHTWIMNFAWYTLRPLVRQQRRYVSLEMAYYLETPHRDPSIQLDIDTLMKTLTEKERYIIEAIYIMGYTHQEANILYNKQYNPITVEYQRKVLVPKIKKKLRQNTSTTDPLPI